MAIKDKKLNIWIYIYIKYKSLYIHIKKSQESMETILLYYYEKTHCAPQGHSLLYFCH